MPSQVTGSGSLATLFTGRVAVMFGSQVVGAVIAVLNGVLLARLLGPAARGDYYLLILIPTTAMAVALFGLPQAFGYFTARGRTIGIVAKSFWLTGLLSTIALLGFLAVLPVLRINVLQGRELGQVLFAFAAMPLTLSGTFSSAILMGRQAVRWKAAVSITALIATTFLIVLIVGGLRLSVNGAIAVYVTAMAIAALGYAIGARRVTQAVETDAEPVSFRELLRYGLPLYPASVTTFLNYRVDIYLIAWLLADSSASLGYYSMAVSLAELVFYLPDAVSVLFFPHVAGSRRADSDRQVAVVCRITLLLTGIVAVLLVPASIVLISVVLPAFTPSILPLMVLLPGIVALSSGKVIAGYLIGIARPGIVSVLTVATFVINVAANLILIPRFGIVGAAGGSLISYSSSMLLTALVAARLSGTPLASFLVPRASDARYVLAVSLGLVRALRTRVRSVAPGHGS